MTTLPQTASRHAYSALGLLVLLGLLFSPYDYGINDQTTEVPVFKARFDPTLYARDLTIDFAKRNYVSYLDTLVYPLYRMAGMEEAAHHLFLVCRLLFYLAVFLIAARVSGGMPAGMLAVILLFFSIEATGGVRTLDLELKARSFGLAGALLSFLLLLGRRWQAAGAVLCVTICVHLVTAVNALLLMGIYLGLCAATDRGERGSALKAALTMAGWTLAGLALLYVKRILSAPEADPFTPMDAQWLSLVLQRSSHHLTPVPDQYVFCLTFSALLLASFYFLRAPGDDVASRICLASILIAVAGLVLNRFFVFTRPATIGLQMCFLRTGILSFVLNYAMAAVLISRLFGARWCAPAGLAFAFIPQAWQLWALAAAAAASLFRGPRILKATQGQEAPWWAYWAIVLAFLGVIVWRGYRPLPEGPTSTDRRPSYGLQLAMKELTPKDALILVPPYEEVRDFRILSERSIVGTWKDWTYSILGRGYAFEMAERLKDIAGIQPNNCRGYGCNVLAKQHYLTISGDEMVRIARKYGATHVVIEKNRPALPLQPIYENDRYVLYVMPPAPAGQGAAS